MQAAPQDGQEAPVEVLQIPMHVGSQDGVEASPEAGGAVGEFVGEGALALIEAPDGPIEGSVEPLATVGAYQRFEGRRPARADRQSNIPRVGDEGTAIPRAGIRPAR